MISSSGSCFPPGNATCPHAHRRAVLKSSQYAAFRLESDTPEIQAQHLSSRSPCTRLYYNETRSGKVKKVELRLMSANNDFLGEYCYSLKFSRLANFPVQRGYPKRGICSRQACLERSRKDAKNAKSGSLISLRPLRRCSGHALRLCGRYSKFWLRLCRARFFAVKLFLLSLEPFSNSIIRLCG